MSFFDKLTAPWQWGTKQTVESYIRLETADDAYTLAATDGSLVSYIRIDGSRQIIGDDEYQHLIESSTIKMGARFDRPGHALQIFFSRNPARAKDHLSTLLKPSRNTTENIGLELEDLYSERLENMARYTSHENCYFVLWTRPSILSKAEMKRAAEEAKNTEWVNAGYAQNPLAGLDILRTRHKSYVSAINAALEDLGIQAELLDAHEALREVRNNLFPTKAHNGWKPTLPGDKITPRAPENEVDASDILWPSLKQQLAAGDARVINQSIVQIDDLYWGAADMTLGPMDPSPFPMLMARLIDNRMPFRISFMIEGGGAQASNFRALAATLLSVTNSVNKQIKFSLEGLQHLAHSEAVVKMRVSLATWAPAGKLELIRDRQSALIQALESWGYCQASDFSGDALDQVMSSAMGIHCAGTAPAAIAPMYEVMKLIPWQRPSSPFPTGAIMFRTPDGKVWPYQTGTNLTTTWFDLIFAQPGAGKSVLMNSLSLGTCLTPGLSKLPYVAIIDIGPSSSGLVSMLKESLPASRQHEVAYYRLQMSQKYAVNPFDTQLGCRAPLIDERSYLIELLTLLCTPPGQQTPYDGIQQLAGLVVDEMYRWRNDDEANAEPRPYLPRLDPEVDEAIQKHNIHLPSDPYWWDIVDKMFEIEQYHIANLAQRHAVPTLSDAITASRRPQIRTLLEETSVGGSAEKLINAFERMITSAIREYPILASVTQFEITDARVCALDLMDVCPQGDDTADRQTSIMYMLARHVLVRSWWMGPEAINSIPEKYRGYHETRLRDIMESPKRLCYDEFHRTSKSRSVRGQIIRDVREGRKRGVQIVLASQLLDDFDDDMVNLATGVWVLGTAVSERAVQDVTSRFGLSDTARNVIRYNLTGPKSGGAPLLLVLGTTDGRYEQHLVNTLGPIELWALSTSAEDVAVRSRLYNNLGAKTARQILAKYFPGGSARNEIKRRVLQKADAGEARNAATSVVIEEIVEELTRRAMARKRPEPNE